MKMTERFSGNPGSAEARRARPALLGVAPSAAGRLAAVLALLFCACCAKTTVVLLPDDDGHVGRVLVQAEKNQATLASAEAAVDVTSSVSGQRAMSQAEIERIFGRALAAAPARPESILLSFGFESTEMDQASRRLIPAVVERIVSRPHPNVDIIGHTDRTGEGEFNQNLSVARAEAVRKLLIAKGVPPEVLKTYGFGYNDPLVPAPRGKYEPRNRRVEVFIR